jgi:hypothetical protein
MARTAKNYDGTASTNKLFKDLLPKELSSIQNQFKDRPDLVLASWPSIIGAIHAPMTEAHSFKEGILTVKVKNSSLYSLLKKHEESKLLAKLRSQFPNLLIRAINFRMG